MKHVYAYSTLSDISSAVLEIATQLQHIDARLVVYFASSCHDGQATAKAMHAAFPKTATVGCTTSGEIVSGKMLDRSIVAMAFGPEIVTRVAIQLVKGISGDTRRAVKEAFDAFAHELGEPISALNSGTHVGLVLADGLSGAEERLMDAIGDFTNIPFVGGSAGDDLKFESTSVFIGETAQTDSAALVLIECACPFEIVKTQSFKILPQTLVATKVDQAKRQVLEFDHKPAVKAYAEALNIDAKDVSARFMTNPVGLVIDGEAFVRSPQRVDGESMIFFCSIIEGMELSLLESTDIVADTAAAIARVKEPIAIINFNCILRTLELKQKDQCPAYGEVFAKIPTVGFSTYGEEYLGHVNQTAALLVFRAQ